MTVTDQFETTSQSAGAGTSTATAPVPIRSEVARLAPERLARAKAAYATRRVPAVAMQTLITGEVSPNSGDLVLARIDRKRQHGRIELTHGRRANLSVGDEVILCYADRYAPDQFEAEVPSNLGPTHMVAAGGIAAQMVSRCRTVKPATEITPLGLIGNRKGNRINLRDWALPTPPRHPRRPATIAVVGTSMNAGKTSAAAALVNGLSRADLQVGAAKVTGTGAGGDFWKMQDSGATPVLDFTDMGFASTYRIPFVEVERILTGIVDHLAHSGVEVAVLEVADGLLQRETDALLSSEVFRSTVDRVIFAAGDALGAMAGLDWLRQRQIDVTAISGTLTRAPLAVREATAATELPVLSLGQLADPTIALALVEPCFVQELQLAG